jgi:hypothetical protein
MKSRSLSVRLLSGAALGAGAVLIGHALEWPDFSGRSGFLGTHYIDSILYSIGNDTCGYERLEGEFPDSPNERPAEEGSRLPVARMRKQCAGASGSPFGVITLATVQGGVPPSRQWMQR